MKYLPLIFIFSLFLLSSCQEKSKSSSSTSCVGTNYYTVAGCPGYNPYTSTTGGTTCTYGTNYYQMPGCPGYCQLYPSNAYCAGTTGTTTGGIITNPYTQYPSYPVATQWAGKYPGGVPAGTCSSSYSPSGVSYTPYDTRQATMTIVGKTWYNPADAVAPNYLNTSSLLKSVSGARQLFETDSVLKVRFKVIQQPESSSSSPYCYGRQTGSAIAGYTQLQYNVSLVGLTSSGQEVSEPIGTYTTGVNSCSPAIDLSSYTSRYPGGVYLIVQSVKGNQAWFPNDYDTNGFKSVTSFVDIRSQDCWVLQVEVAADGTKTFD